MKYYHNFRNYFLDITLIFKWEITVLHEMIVHEVNMSINLGDTTEHIKEIFSYISFPICLFKHALFNLIFVSFQVQ